MRRRRLSRAIIFLKLGANAYRPDEFGSEAEMFRLADRFVLPCCAVLLPLAAHSSPLSIYLRDYYTEYQVVKECTVRARLSAEDAAAAKSAVTTIEAYYLRRDPAIDKASLKKQAIGNKNSAFRMVMQTDKVDLREFCLGSLHDLLGKSRGIVADTTPEKNGS